MSLPSHSSCSCHHDVISRFEAQCQTKRRTAARRYQRLKSFISHFPSVTQEDEIFKFAHDISADIFNTVNEGQRICLLNFLGIIFTAWVEGSVGLPRTQRTLEIVEILLDPLELSRYPEKLESPSHHLKDSCIDPITKFEVTIHTLPHLKCIRLLSEPSSHLPFKMH